MTFRRFATGAALAIAGLAAAVGIGLLANSISGDSVGLGAEPLSAGETLAPATVKAENRQRQHQRQRQRRNRNRGGEETRATTSPTLTDELSPAEPGDDDGGQGRGRGRGRGGDDSSSSGSGSSGSDDSSGSGSSGSGSGDSGELDDD
jgi:hypothetical protein